MRKSLLALVAVLACLDTGCVASHRAADVPVAAAGPRSVYVAVGASETVGVGADNPIRQSWPQVLYRTALPAGTVFYDLGVSGSTVGEAVDQQLPEAIRLRPTIATVWLNVNDVAALERIGSYEATLRSLVHGLLPPDLFEDGANELTAYVVEGPPGDETLRPLDIVD